MMKEKSKMSLIMIQYFDDGDLACVDGFSFRRDKRTGYYLSSQKIGEKRKRLHVYIWEKINGKTTKGYHIHHVDGNKKNNEIENLEILTHKEHAKLHGSSWSEERKEKNRKMLKEKAIPMASKWHGSQEGIEWHRKHGKEIMSKRCEIKYNCTYCGKEFLSKHKYGKNSNRFCTNNCKSAYRRKMGFDDVKKICENCGGEYIANKYSKTKYCESCKH